MYRSDINAISGKVPFPRLCNREHSKVYEMGKSEIKEEHLFYYQRMKIFQGLCCKLKRQKAPDQKDNFNVSYRRLMVPNLIYK